MKKRKKGFTMLELMISIVIVSIVMIFLVQMLIDIRYESENEIYDSANQINRAEIIKVIQQDIQEKKGLKDIYYTDDKFYFDTVNNIKTCFKITGNDSAKTTVFTYESPCGNDPKAWELAYNTVDTKAYRIGLITYSENDFSDGGNEEDDNSFNVTLDIPIIVNRNKQKINDKINDSSILFKDSKMDNIILTFSTKSSLPSNLNNFCIGEKAKCDEYNSYTTYDG